MLDGKTNGHYCTVYNPCRMKGYRSPLSRSESLERGRGNFPCEFHGYAVYFLRFRRSKAENCSARIRRASGKRRNNSRDPDGTRPQFSLISLCLLFVFPAALGSARQPPAGKGEEGENGMGKRPAVNNACFRSATYGYARTVEEGNLAGNSNEN